ncbi:MAG: hypothetical protein Q4A41_04225 [Bacillota bacterium]|nr:hypothetical protein [Bacillota bacterium]
MAALNYAQKWEAGLIKTFIDGSYIAPFVATDVNFIGAKTFHFTTLNTSGYKAHSLAGGWQRGTYNQKDHPYTLEHDRDVEFFIDKRDVDETNKTASIQNISAQFQRTQATPEMDAQFFSKIAAEAANGEFHRNRKLGQDQRAQETERDHRKGEKIPFRRACTVRSPGDHGRAVT